MSLVALVTLLLAKIFKPKLIKRYKWVSLIPEILIVVVIATCELPSVDFYSEFDED